VNSLVVGVLFQNLYIIKIQKLRVILLKLMKNIVLIFPQGMKLKQKMLFTIIESKSLNYRLLRNFKVYKYKHLGKMKIK